MPGHGLDAIFRPGSIAIIGASQDETKIGGRPVQLLRKYGYPGLVYPVNPKADEVQGYKAYPSVADLPQAPDLAVIAVAAAIAPKAVAECAERGIRAAVILSSGFAELGEEGEKLQEELRTIARTTGIRLLGPNCLGSVSIPEKAIATFSIVLENSLPTAGPLGLVSQSGNLGSYTMLLASERGAGISRFITTGNECDIDVADGVAWMARDADTRVILLCIETCRDAPRLIAALEEAREAGKPVVVLKIGSSDAGQAAAASHTGALAGSDAVFDAVFARCGAVRVHSIEALLNVGHAAAILGMARMPRGPRLAVVAASGGFGVMVADAATEAGLTLPAMSAATQARVLAAVPYASPRNPVDATAQMSSRPEILEQVLSAVIEDDASDSVILIMTSSLYLPRLRQVYMQALTKVRQDYPQRMILLCTHGPQDAMQELNALGYPTVDGVDAACQTLAALTRFGTGSKRYPSVSMPPALTPEPEAFRTEFGAKQALAMAGIPVLPERLVQSAEAAMTAADELACPVVMKIASPDLPHKTEIGGVMIGIASPEEAGKAYGAIMQRVQAKAPKARIDGVLVAPMVRGGTELILGTKHDPIFGPVVMVGFGGIFAEIMQDVAVRPAPVHPDEAMDMLRSLKGFAILDGARNRPRADLEAVARAVADLSVFAAQHGGQIAEIDINPLLVRPAGQGAVALDALIIAPSSKDHSHV